jgi:hypothetical protein
MKIISMGWDYVCELQPPTDLSYRWYMSMENRDRISTRRTSDSSTRAPWQSYQKSSSSKAGGTGEGNDTVMNSQVLFHNGTLLHSKSQYTTVKHNRKLFEHTYASDLYGLGTPTPIEFFQHNLLWQSSNTHSHSCSQKASKHTSVQSIVGLSVHLHTTTALGGIFQR